MDRQLESIAATGADHVFTLTQALADELHARGVNRAKIELAPNAIDPEAFSPVERDISLSESLGIGQAPFVMGYIGSVVAYEGLDDLVTAFDRVVKQVPGAKLVFVGDGDAMPSLRTQVKTLGLEAGVVFAGKVKPEQVRRYFSLLDVVVLPRKPFKVCQLVSPLKPLEAMAMAIPLVVSDVAALKEMVRENETALVHKAGDPASLAACLVRLANDRSLGDRLSYAARQEVLATRTWAKVAAQISRSYSVIMGHSSTTAGETSSVKAKPEAESQLPQMDDGTARLASFDVVPLPAGRNSMTEEEKVQFKERLDSILKTHGLTAFERFLEQQMAHHSQKFMAFCRLKAASVALANGDISTATRMAEMALKHDSGITSVRGAAHLYYNADLLGKANELATRLESMQESVSEGDRKFIAKVRGRAQQAA